MIYHAKKLLITTTIIIVDAKSVQSVAYTRPWSHSDM